jgi:hypothetical protein
MRLVDTQGRLLGADEFEGFDHFRS